MEKIEILQKVISDADAIWARLGEIHPRLKTKPVPDIALNNRYWRTAGMAYQAENYIELGSKFFLHSPIYCEIMFKVILPHEICHIADWVLFGESEMSCGHGANWRMLMVQLGLKPNKFHRMLKVKR